MKKKNVFLVLLIALCVVGPVFAVDGLNAGEINTGAVETLNVSLDFSDGSNEFIRFGLANQDLSSDFSASTPVTSWGGTIAELTIDSATSSIAKHDPEADLYLYYQALSKKKFDITIKTTPLKATGATSAPEIHWMISDSNSSYDDVSTGKYEKSNDDAATIFFSHDGTSNSTGAQAKKLYIVTEDFKDKNIVAAEYTATATVGIQSSL